MLIKNSDTSKKIPVLMVDSSDHITAKTGISPLTVTVSKNGGTFATITGSVAELANGIYLITPSSGDVGTNGSAVFHATGAGADPTDVLCQVVAFDPYSADFGWGAMTVSHAPTAGTREEALAGGRAAAFGKREWDASANETFLSWDDATPIKVHVVKDRSGANLAAPATGQPTQRT